MSITIDDYASQKPAWCPGCGNFGILAALKQALVDLQIPPHRILFVSGIGQAGKLPHYLKCNLFNGLHGRAIPVAIGAHLANHELIVVAEGGDGDGYGEGGNHWLHATRRNHRIAYFVHNNQVYGLTKGQFSPTSDPGFITKTSPLGAGIPMNPIVLAIAAGGTFVARGFAGDIEHLTGLLRQAITHNGFAFVDILQPCVSFNRQNTFEWYRQRVYHLEKEMQFDTSDWTSALTKAREWGDRIPIGIFYRIQKPTFEESIPVLRQKPLVNSTVGTDTLQKLLNEFS
jgi:2-oxoglutarate ferredoxin oxidoreductase subunit beta